MTPKERCHPPSLVGAHALQPDRFAKHALEHQSVDVDHAVLQQVQGQHGCLLVLQPVGGDLATAAIEDEIVGAIPGFDHVQALMDLAPQFHPVQVTAKECRAQRLTKLDQSSVRGVLQIGAGETAQDVRRSCSAESKCRRELHHLVVLATDQIPIDRP